MYKEEVPCGSLVNNQVTKTESGRLKAEGGKPTAKRGKRLKIYYLPIRKY